VAYKAKNKKPTTPKPKGNGGRDFESMAKRKKKRDEETLERMDDLGSGEMKDQEAHQETGFSGCTNDSCPTTVGQAPPEGRAFQTGSRDAADVAKENMESAQRILEGEGGGSEGYKTMAMEQVYDRELAKEQIADLREMLRSGEITADEFKAGREEIIMKTREKKKQSSEDFKEAYAAAREEAMEDDDSSMSMGDSPRRRGFRIRSTRVSPGTVEEQMVVIPRKKVRLT